MRGVPGYGSKTPPIGARRALPPVRYGTRIRHPPPSTNTKAANWGWRSGILYVRAVCFFFYPYDIAYSRAAVALAKLHCTARHIRHTRHTQTHSDATEHHPKHPRTQVGALVLTVRHEAVPLRAKACRARKGSCT